MAAEKLTLAASATYEQTQFHLVRYGNVINSRGAVLEVFQRLLAQGEPCLPVTHLDMSRFFMTLTDAVSLVSMALMQPGSGYCFVPHLSAFTLRMLLQILLGRLDLRETVDYHLLGIQPGEKLHESLMTQSEQRRTLWRPGALASGDCYAIAPAASTPAQRAAMLPDWHPFHWNGRYASGQAGRQLSLEGLYAHLVLLQGISRFPALPTLMPVHENGQRVFQPVQSLMAERV